MRSTRHLAVALTLGALFLLQRGGLCDHRAPKVRVTQAAFHGWQGAYRLSNGLVDVVVVPSIGRIMVFEYTGQPETNALFNNPLWAGKPPPSTPSAADPKTYPTEWHNYGGDKLWPSEQSTWPKHQPVGWPPDPAFDTGPYQVTRLPGGVRLTGPVSPYFGIRVVREVTLTPGHAIVSIHDTFVKAGGQGTAFPIGIWSISQVRGDSTIYFPITKHGLFPGLGFTPLMDGAKLQPNWKAQGGLLAVTRPSNIGTKVGVDDQEGWAACLYNGNLLFSEHFTREPQAKYPDHGADAEAFTNGDDTQAYMELEVLGPMVVLKPGQTLSRQITWHLQRLPKTPASDAEAVTAVRTAQRKG